MSQDSIEGKLGRGLPDAGRHLEPTPPLGSEPDLLLPQLSPPVYQWSVRLFNLVRRMLAVNIRLHGPVDWLRQGDIFLFNHFARFETFVPQYLIHRETGFYCRSVASHELFKGSDRFTNYLLNVGAVSNEHPDLLAFLGAEILRGRKIVVFPEGGMVKDRRVQDDGGSYTVYSRSAERRRPHHSGAAVLALALSRFKQAALQAAAAGDARRINNWARKLGFGSGEQLLLAARRPTRIVPANITFYPIRMDSNLLRRAASMLGRDWSPRALEELLVEGHLLLRNTDMDIRLGAPLDVQFRASGLGWPRVIRDPDEFVTYFRPSEVRRRWWGSRQGRGVRHGIVQLRDDYMRRIYAEVTVNLSHLAARVIFALIAAGHDRIAIDGFCRMLYLAVKRCQGQTEIALHRSLKNPEWYRDLVHGVIPGLQQFIDASVETGLLSQDELELRFLPKLCEEHGFDQVRLENPILVYANEVAPLKPVVEAVAYAMEQARSIQSEDLARLRFDDEIVEYRWDRFSFSKPRHAAINAGQTATADPAPYLLDGQPGRLGVVLAHGLLASPAELRPLGDRLNEAGYTVLGVRLKGHGTSPWDLNSRSWTDWLASLDRAREILSALCPAVCLIGFSAGGTLSLRMAQTSPEPIAGIATVAAALKFKDRKMALVPLVHNANKLMRWIAASNKRSTFYPNDPEFPKINYRHIPIRALWELRRLVDTTRASLGDLRCPLRVVHADDDPVIDVESARLIMAESASEQKFLHRVDASWHGIIRRDPGDVVSGLVEFIDQRQAELDAPTAAPAGV